jgi:hypothetical protein
MSSGWKDVTKEAKAERDALILNSLPTNLGETFYKAYRKRQLFAQVMIRNGRFQMSISHRKRYPTWDEIRDARYDLIPKEIWMAMLLPPPSDYINYSKFCFNLVQVPPESL